MQWRLSPLKWWKQSPLPEHVRVREIASAKGAKLRLPKARSPFRLRNLRERRKLPQRRDFEHFMPNGAHLGLSLISYFEQSNRKNSRPTALPTPRSMKKFDHSILYCMRGN